MQGKKQQEWGGGARHERWERKAKMGRVEAQSTQEGAVESGSPAPTAEAGPTPTSHTHLSWVRLKEGQRLLLLGREVK